MFPLNSTKGIAMHDVTIILVELLLFSTNLIHQRCTAVCTCTFATFLKYAIMRQKMAMCSDWWQSISIISRLQGRIVLVTFTTWDPLGVCIVWLFLCHISLKVFQYTWITFPLFIYYLLQAGISLSWHKKKSLILQDVNSNIHTQEPGNIHEGDIHGSKGQSGLATDTWKITLCSTQRTIHWRRMVFLLIVLIVPYCKPLLNFYIKG